MFILIRFLIVGGKIHIFLLFSNTLKCANKIATAGQRWVWIFLTLWPCHSAFEPKNIRLHVMQKIVFSSKFGGRSMINCWLTMMNARITQIIDQLIDVFFFYLWACKNSPPWTHDNWSDKIQDTSCLMWCPKLRRRDFCCSMSWFCFAWFHIMES